MQPTDQAPNNNDNGGQPVLPPATPMQPAPTTAPPLPGQHPLPSQDQQNQAPTTADSVPLEPTGTTDQPSPLPPGAVMPGLDRPLTYGERAVGLTFNPSGREDVNNVKRLYAALIDKHHTMRDEATDPETKRLHALAITNLQTAQMWSVKALTWEA